jgi:hypothetical protein
MKIMSACLLFVLLAACHAAKKIPKAQVLFNGTNLDNWIVKIKDHPLNENYGNTFRVADGVMKVSYDQYDDFKEQYGHIFYNQPFTAYLTDRGDTFHSLSQRKVSPLCGSLQ